MSGAAELVELLVEDARWEAFDLAGLADTVRRAALEAAGLDPARYSISLLACDDARIAALNAEFRGRSRPTNVLSWPAFSLRSGNAGGCPHLPPPAPRNHPESLGDIALSLDMLLAEAREAGVTPRDHLRHLLLHATLHLLGYDHEEDADATLMEGLESQILARMGVEDPYCHSDPAEGSVF